MDDPNNPDSGNQICKLYPKEECEIKTETNTAYSPRTECSRVESEVCGPENCPLVKAEPLCEDKLEEVRIMQRKILRRGVFFCYHPLFLTNSQRFLCLMKNELYCYSNHDVQI